MVTYGVLLMGSLGFFLYGAVFMLPIFVARTFHYDATQTGQMFIPGSILTALMMPFIGKQMQKGRDPKILIFIGLISIEFCLYLMTRFSPQTTYQQLIVMLFVRGFAMAFLFVPINSSILSQFKGIDLGQVAGMLNLFRQIGGSMGIALIASLLAINSHQNYLDLVSRISMLNPTTVQTYLQSQNGMTHKMTEAVGMSTPMAATLKTLYYRIQNQVFMMSFIQLVWVIMFVFAFSFIALWRIRFKSKTTVVMDAH